MLIRNLTYGKTLPDLDNAYVTDVTSTDDTDVSIREGGSFADRPYLVPAGYVLITLDLGDGEGYLILPADTEISARD